jgi:hypothetical protein
MVNSASGSLIIFARKPTTPFVTNNCFLVHCNTTNELQTIAFGINPQGTGTANRFSACYMTTSSLNRRDWIGSTDTSALAADRYHMFVITAAGTGGVAPLMYVNAVAETVSTTTNGTPPATDAWLDDAQHANSRIAMGNARYASVSSDYTGWLSSVAYIDGVILSQAQINALYAFRVN